MGFKHYYTPRSKREAIESIVKMTNGKYEARDFRYHRANQVRAIQARIVVEHEGKHYDNQRAY